MCSEGAGTLVVTVNRSGGSANVVTVNYGTTNGTATAGTDYTGKNSPVRLLLVTASPARRSAMPIINGSIARPDRKFFVNLYTPERRGHLGNPHQCARGNHQ